MQILVIDREPLTNQLISSKLEAKGHTVIVEPSKNKALEKIKEGSFDCIMLDPAPLSEARPVVIGVWKNLPTETKPYLILLSKIATQEEAVRAGINDVLLKPFSKVDIETKVDNAERLIKTCRNLEKADNIHSSGGLIGKEAFNQLFLSAIDRAFRYEEKSSVVFLNMTNYDDVVASCGQEVADDTIQKLTKKMSYMRRQSDVVGQLGLHEFGILLQRPQYETETMDAINRFSEILDKFYAEFENKESAPKLTLRLVELPQGALHAEKSVPIVRMNRMHDKEL